MESYYDHTDHARADATGIVRRLPYAPEGEKIHYDFLMNPSLIPEVLEDFRPFGDHRGIQKFYRLLRYLNGPRSLFETTDSAFRPPRDNPTPHLGNGAPLEVRGRLMLVFRDHAENLSEQAMHGLRIAFQDELSRVRPGWPMGCIGTSFYWAWFTSLSAEPSEEATGLELVLLPFAWGHSGSECCANFGTLMQGVGVALCQSQRRFLHWVAQGRPSLLQNG
jgi:hypothetical protein